VNCEFGAEIYSLAKRLWPINRSITGDGVRQTLKILRELVPGMKIYEVPSGTRVFDWVVPKEWRVRDAYIITPSGNKICSFKENNLHLVGYSTPIAKSLPLEELQQHIYSIPEQPTAIPYITSYYKERWGFCMSQQMRDSLKNWGGGGDYQVFIDAELFDGNLTYGEILVPGETDREVLFSTYVCHPSMANNELSGPAVTIFLAKRLLERGNNHFSYRFIFIPETIGSITYLSRNKDELKDRVVAGFNVSCVGDDRAYSYLPSRRGNTLSDRVAKHVLRHIAPDYVAYSWRDRGSDERQYCSPGIDLPIASIMRTKYGEYPEYHTSLDDLVNVVSPAGLAGGFSVLWQAIEAIEASVYPTVAVFCEPQLGKRGLYPTLSTRDSGKSVKLMMDLISYSDGDRSLLDIAELCDCPIGELLPIARKLGENRLLNINRTRRREKY
jgi:aminopeptidase-like protein